MLLFVFPYEIFDQISQFLTGDEHVNLMLTGNHGLIRKMRQVSNITVRWKSSQLCEWDACLPFIKAFPKLETLRLTTMLPLHRSRYALELGNLPSSLTSLTLDYFGAMDIMRRSQPFRDMSSLTYLSVSRKHDANVPKNIHLEGLPSSLRHLFLRSESDSFFIEELKLLPSGIETFDCDLEGKANAPFVDVFSPNPPSITHLAINANRVDITHIAAGIRHLQLFRGGSLTYRGAPIERFSLGHGTPIRSIMPLLHTLVLPPSQSVSWSVFETLPLSLTRLECQQLFLPLGENDIVKICARLNDAHVNTPLPDRPGAPMMIRQIGGSVVGSNFLRVLQYFSSLEHFEEFASFVSVTEVQLPTSIRSIRVKHFESPPALSSPSITSIVCSILDIDPLVNGMRLDTPTLSKSSPESASQFSHLVNLSVTTSSFTPDMVFALPKTLETLDMISMEGNGLEALSTRANQDLLLPNLRSLFVTIDGGTEVLVTLDLLPRTIKVLQLKKAYTIPLSSSTLSIGYHKALEDLRLTNPISLGDLVPALPPQLLRARLCLSHSLDLNDPAIVDHLSALPSGLRTLHITVLNRERRSVHWVAHARPFTCLSIESLRLIWGSRSVAELKLQLLRALPGALVPKYLLALASERLVKTYLPSNLNQLEALIPSTSTIMLGRNTEWLWRRIFAAFWLRDLSSFLTPMVASHLPLVGLFFRRQYQPSLQLPADSSHEMRRHRDAAYSPRLTAFPFENAKHEQESFERDILLSNPHNIYSFRVFFYLSNLLAWSHLAYFLALDRRQHPWAWAVQWSHIIGSAIALPLQIYSMRRAFPVIRASFPTRYRLFIHYALGCALCTVPSTAFLWLTNYSTAVALGYSASRWSVAKRIVAGVVALAGEYGIRFMTSMLFGVD